MYAIRDDVNLSSMKRIGIITVDKSRLYSDIQRYINKKGITPTEFFYNKMQKNTYHAGETPILSYQNDGNLIVAKKDNDAIFLYSENQVLSPTQFINLFVYLYEIAKNLSFELERNTYCNFGIEDLNINFVNTILATGITPKFMEEYDSNLKKDNNVYVSELNNIKSIYNAQNEEIRYNYCSQYGMNVLKFLDTMINLNPDIRLLMSNTVISSSETALKHIFLDTIRNNYNDYTNLMPMEIAHRIDSSIKAGKELDEEEKEKFFQFFEEERRKTNYRIKSSNSEYKVFPVLKYVLKLKMEDEEELENLDFKYLLRWDEGDPDNGRLAINRALEVMLNTMILESETGIKACRNLEQVKQYMSNIQNKAIELNNRIKEQENKEQENKIVL